MKTLLKLKHYHIFLIVLLGIILMGFKVEGNTHLTAFLYIVGTVLWLLWPLAVGHELHKLLPRKIEVNYNLFVVNLILTVTVVALVSILSDGEEMTFRGVEMIPFIYLMYATINSLSFPAKVLNSIERNREVSLSEYIGDFFLIVFLPIGIWFLQPRINRILENKELVAD